MTVTFWASTDVIHLTIAGARVKTVRSHLSTADLTALAAAGRPASRAAAAAARRARRRDRGRPDRQQGRRMSAWPAATSSPRRSSAAAGSRIRVEENTLMFFDPETRELLRTRPSPLTWDQARRLRGARPAGPPPRPSAEPVTAQRRGQQHRRHHGRRAEDRPRPHPRPADRHRPRRRRTPSPSTWAATTPAPSGGPPPSRSAASKPSSPARPPMFPRQPGKHVLGLIRQSSGGTRHSGRAEPLCGTLRRAGCRTIRCGRKIRSHVRWC